MGNCKRIRLRSWKGIRHTRLKHLERNACICPVYTHPSLSVCLFEPSCEVDAAVAGFASGECGGAVSGPGRVFGEGVRVGEDWLRERGDGLVRKEGSRTRRRDRSHRGEGLSLFRSGDSQLRNGDLWQSLIHHHSIVMRVRHRTPMRIQSRTRVRESTGKELRHLARTSSAIPALIWILSSGTSLECVRTPVIYTYVERWWICAHPQVEERRGS